MRMQLGERVGPLVGKSPILGITRVFSFFHFRSSSFLAMISDWTAAVSFVVLAFVGSV